MIMEPFEAYRLYQSMKLHFSSESYDAIKYNYKTSAKPESFWKRRDKYQFAKVGRMFDNPNELIHFYAAHFVGGNEWIGDMAIDDSTYTQWSKRNQALGYMFEQDMCHLATLGSLDDVLKVNNSQHPLAVSEWVRGSINIESVVLLHVLTGFVDKADKQITETIVWPDLSRKIRKYTPFVHMDLLKAKNIVLKVFTN